MTKIIVVKQNNSIAEVTCDGHTGYGVEGEDIVCAGLSCIIQTAILGLLKVAKVELDMDRRDDEGYIRFKLPNNMPDKTRIAVDIILETMLLGVADLHLGYSDFIELEVQ